MDAGTSGTCFRCMRRPRPWAEAARLPQVTTPSAAHSNSSTGLVKVTTSDFDASGRHGVGGGEMGDGAHDRHGPEEFGVAISTAVQRGSQVYVYDEKGRQLFVISAGDGLQGFTGSSVSVRRMNQVYIYDERGRQKSVVPAR